MAQRDCSSSIFRRHKLHSVSSVYLLQIHSAQLIYGWSCITDARKRCKQYYGNCSFVCCFCLTCRQSAFFWTQFKPYGLNFLLTHAQEHVGGIKPQCCPSICLFVVPFSVGYWSSKCTLRNALSYLVAQAATVLRCGWVNIWTNYPMLAVRPGNQSVSVCLQSASRLWFGPDLHPFA